MLLSSHVVLPTSLYVATSSEAAKNTFSSNKFNDATHLPLGSPDPDFSAPRQFCD